MAIALPTACAHQGGDDQPERHWNAIGPVVESVFALSACFRDRLAWIGGSRSIGVVENRLFHGAAPMLAKRGDQKKLELRIATILNVSNSGRLSVGLWESTGTSVVMFDLRKARACSFVTAKAALVRSGIVPRRNVRRCGPWIFTSCESMAFRETPVEMQAISQELPLSRENRVQTQAKNNGPMRMNAPKKATPVMNAVLA